MDWYHYILAGFFLASLPELYRLRQESKWRNVENTWEYVHKRMEDDTEDS